MLSIEPDLRHPMLGLLPCDGGATERCVALMARKAGFLSVSPTNPTPPTGKAMAALERDAAKIDLVPLRKRGIGNLIKHRARLEALLVRLADIFDQLDFSVRRRVPKEVSRLSAKLRRQEEQIARSLVAIDRRILRTPARSLDDAIMKLNLCVAMHGYEPESKTRSKRSLPVEISMLLSAIDDLHRLNRSGALSPAARQQSSDRKRPIKAGK